MSNFDTIAPNIKHDQNRDDLTIPGRRTHKPDSKLDIGDVILERYKVLTFLGRGGMGIVYKCFDEIAGVEVALKALPPQLSYDQLEMDAFKRNFQLVHNLHHPNIANLNQLVQDPRNGCYYLVMEYIQGTTLTEYMKNNNTSTEQKKHILMQVASALDFVHRQKLIHRDIKPDNIMITVDGTAKILDFGIAAKVAENMYEKTDDSFCGSLLYIAPELWDQDKKAEISSAVDRYALAVIVFEWTCGHHPFCDGAKYTLKENITNGNIVFPGKINLRQKAVLKKALKNTPEDRYSSCSLFIRSFFEPPFYLQTKFICTAAAFLLAFLVAFVVIVAMKNIPPKLPPDLPPVPQQPSVISLKKSPRLLIRSKENIRNLESDNLSQGLLQELALSYGFQTVNPEYVQDKNDYDFVIDVRFTGAYRTETFSFNKNLKLHAFSLGADMSATYPNGNLISQVTLPSQDFRIGKIGDPQEALREYMRKRIISKEDVSFHNILMQILEKWYQEIKSGMSVSVIIKSSADIANDIQQDILEVLKKRNLISDYVIRSQDNEGKLIVDLTSRMQGMDIANLFVILSDKRLKINSVEYGKIIFERK